MINGLDELKHSTIVGMMGFVLLDSFYLNLLYILDLS